MEILNNIISILSTPNQPLINLILFVATFIENYLTLKLFIAITKVEYKPLQIILYVLIMSIVSLITMFAVTQPFNIFLNYFIVLTLQYLIFKNNFVKSFIASVLSIILFNLIGILILNPFITIFNITSEQLSTIPIYRLLYLLLIYVITTICIIILKHSKLNFSFSESINKKDKAVIIANLCIGILAIIVQSITLFYYVDRLPIFITFLGFISLVVYFMLSIYTLTRIFKLIITTQELESTKEYNRSLHILHDGVRGFKHDFDNILTTIGGYIATNDMNGLKKYYSELEHDSQKINNLYLLNPEIINNGGIYNLLAKKYYEASSKDIKFNITFLLDLNSLHMKIYEFARILGILLDNAIEASSECEEKIINLVFKDDHKNSRQLVLIENTYKNKDIDTERIFEKGLSSKQDHSGIGLWEVKKLVEHNNNVSLFTSKTDKYFSQKLEIYY